jgi:hypothetical protein
MPRNGQVVMRRIEITSLRVDKCAQEMEQGAL